MWEEPGGHGCDEVCRRAGEDGLPVYLVALRVTCNVSSVTSHLNSFLAGGLVLAGGLDRCKTLLLLKVYTQELFVLIDQNMAAQQWQIATIMRVLKL